jgi:hypothetical protein
MQRARRKISLAKHKDVARDAADAAASYARGDGTEAVVRLLNQIPLARYSLQLLTMRPAPPRRRRWFYDQ